TVIGVSLCRCGQSKRKPFCDRSHIAAGFSGKNSESSQVRNLRKNYVGKGITVHDNRRMCSHSAECIRNLKSVFDVSQRPWINADGADVDEIARVVKMCPSGALSYSLDGIEYRDELDREPKVLVSNNGPYLVTGGIDLEGDISWAEEASKEHYALCRCGASENKPFCDGNHLRIRFVDGSA
ncbi:MAG: CDGSH iron-sulfur domain-containing protein, partial [Nitrososphaera sp.]